MKNKSTVPVSYLLEAIQLQKEDEKKEKGGNRQWHKPECYKKNDDNKEGNCKQTRKSSWGKEYSYVYFVLRTG